MTKAGYDGEKRDDEGINGAESERSSVADGGDEDVGVAQVEGRGVGEKVEDVPPNGGYGWVCVACVATINA